ncbi:O-fucosyltransferase 30-like isoform X1 [Salvia splendens]|uniref:O-fucosyltransferase 30-like isoform X1 n=1 Tax=Salvia splendens TaxID=180675 RepID=UPI001C252DDF|nr:O-fucosyltransferase 30-like isoform X1 [Salvia splendens]
MDSGHRHGGGVAGKWKKRPTIFTNYRAPLLLFTFTVIAIFISSKIFISPSLLPLSPDSRPPQCTHTPGEKYLWYAPHSGFSNQLSEFRNAILMAAILNRTLIVPPVLDHHAVALGSCPKFRVLDPNELRFRVWNHSIQLIRDRRYVSMADIVDLSSLVASSAVRFMDFRVFVSKWCDVNLSLACTADSSMHSSLLEKLRQCGSLLSGYDGNVDACLFASQEDCRTTVWTYQTDDGVLDSFQADEELKKKRKFSFSRTRKDVSRALGPGSTAGSATVLAFGSLFTGPYKGSESHIDIHEAPNDQRVQLVIQKIEFLQFVPEILNAGKSFAHEMISAPFICAQLRLLDGQFKNHWDGTFQVLKQTLDSLKQKGSLPIHVFIMTDLPRLNWTGSYLGDLEKDSDSFKLFVLREEDELVTETAKKLVNAAYGLKLQSVSSSFDGREQHCSPLSLPDILLYVEETICGCASLGFVGTAGSTIANSIELMRKNHACS